ncbi:WD40 repeat-like protein [Mycena maculata]|uniref:WD40 repeat-like protein n=1 Tax=Mycena maculata TaxID=230809 RepID=A0AAD7K8X2_9AGAR|nr:WD40 repeat-like protein [Mycena maculata]
MNNDFSSRRRPVLIPNLRNHIPSPRRPQSQRIQAVEALLEHGFPYSRKLTAHTSCVNALAFSSLDGRFLASGGDDLKIHLWDLHEEPVSTPCWSFTGPRKNIFVLAFSAHNRWLYSGGVDNTVLKFDATQLERAPNAQSPRSPELRLYDHDDSIRGIAPHAVQDEIFLTGSEDGRIILHDGRVAPTALPRAQDRIQLAAEVTSVQFHPVMEHVFATSESSGRVCLRDTRMAFGPLAQRTREGVVQIYNTKLSSRSFPHLCNPEASSIVFNHQGTQLGVTMLHYFPTIYALTDPDPLAVCSAPNLPGGTPVPSGERTYVNSCTMKHGSFGGPGLDADALYAAGSDDFHAYIWALPPPAELVARRTVLSHAEWDAGEHSGVVAFAERLTGPRCVPAQLHTPRARLGGHASICNTVLVHPRMLLAASAGVEADIVVHGAVTSLLGGMQPTPAHTRQLEEAWAEGVDRPDGVEELTWLDMQDTIHMFDAILREQGEADVFRIRKWAGRSDGESDSRGDSEGEELGEDDEVDDEMGESRG